jgi:threonine aldolase
LKTSSGFCRQFAASDSFSKLTNDKKDPMAFKDGTADFRSDTVTRPTEAMYKAMVEAPVGDDVYGEDPTVNALEEECAELCGMEAGVFVTTGTQGNGLAVWVQTQPGDDVVCVQTAHVRNYEHGANSAIAGVGFRTVDSANGEMSAEQVREAVQGGVYPAGSVHSVTAGGHYPRPGLLSWENTHNVSGGSVVPFAVMAESTKVAREFGLNVHLDGARIFNAITASGVAASEWGSLVDTVQFCFSKALGAPVGSMLVGSKEVIDEARHRRKMLGGATRQVGVLAGAAKVALDSRGRLIEDHALATQLAEGVAGMYPDATDANSVATNMVLVEESYLPGGVGAFEAALAAVGVRVAAIAPGRLRFVTHHDVDTEDVTKVLKILHELS